MRTLTHVMRFGFTNERAAAAVVQVEPWADHYTVGPGERLELRVRSGPPGVWFNVVQRGDDLVQIYVEGPAPRAPVAWEAFIDGAEVRRGHQPNDALRLSGTRGRGRAPAVSVAGRFCSGVTVSS